MPEAQRGSCGAGRSVILSRLKSSRRGALTESAGIVRQAVTLILIFPHRLFLCCILCNTAHPFAVLLIHMLMLRNTLHRTGRSLVRFVASYCLEVVSLLVGEHL